MMSSTCFVPSNTMTCFSPFAPNDSMRMRVLSICSWWICGLSPTVVFSTISRPLAACRVPASTHSAPANVMPLTIDLMNPPKGHYASIGRPAARDPHSLVRGQPFEQRAGLAKPRTLHPADVVGHRRLLVQDARRPFAGLALAPRGRQEARVVVLSLRQRRGLQDGREQRVRPVTLSHNSERIGEQARGALVVVLLVARDHLLEVGDGAWDIVQRDFAQGAAVERIDRGCLGEGGGRRGVRLRDHRVETLARPRELLVVEILVAKLLVVAERRIVGDEPFAFPDALDAREDLVGAVEEARVGQDLHEDVGEGAKAAAYEDDPEPEGVRPAADEVQDGNGLQEDAIRIEKSEHAGRARL